MSDPEQQSMFQVRVNAVHTKTRARSLHISTPHGAFDTPVFMPVGTRAGVNNLTPQELLAATSQVILGGNTYHMLCAPGMEVIQAAGGMQRFMGWHGPMLTDSGGFQVFSLSKNKTLCQIDENGANFVLPESGQKIYMTPTLSLQTQKIIGADMIMVFDQCTPNQVSYEEAAQIMHRTHRWIQESVAYHQANPCSQYGLPQALFGIIQGGLFESLRKESAQFVTAMNLDGIALGGESIGFDMAATLQIIQSVYSLLPDNKPRYTMGVGMSPQDLLDVIEQGIDMFDCVAPTRNARHGSLYCGKIVATKHWLRFESSFDQGRLLIKKSIFSNDSAPIMPGCECWTCQRHSRAYLHQLYKEHALAFTALASIHNVHVMHAVCTRARELICQTTH